ncbi:Long-chain-alcohol O-fatty-acyltransferase [Bertholletia excelsa]
MEDQATMSSTNQILLFLLSSSYCYYLVAKMRRGISRFIFIIPVLYFFFSLPWNFSSSFLRGIFAFFITWIASFKLLLFCFCKGPLVTCRSLVDFVAITAFPVKIRDHHDLPSPSMDSETLLKLAGNVLLQLQLNSFAGQCDATQFTNFLYGTSVFIWFHTMLASDSSPVRFMPRYELVSLFNRPYLATSLQDFWGRRWNRMSSYILRVSVYEPTRETLAGLIGSGRARVVAIITTLVVSGIMHEVILYYITCGRRPTWEVTWFFILHGLFMGLEVAFRARYWSPLPVFISVPLTVGFTVITSCWLLVLPVWRNATNKCE